MLESLSADHYRLHGDINMQVSSALLHELLALPQRTGACLHLDLSAVGATDSLLLAALLGLVRDLQASGRELRITGLGPGMRGLAATYGIDTLLDGVMEDEA